MIDKPSEFELWTYTQPGDLFEMSEGSQRRMFDSYKILTNEIKRLKSELHETKMEIASHYSKDAFNG